MENSPENKRPLPEPPTYKNRKGKIVKVFITPHARRRFLERWYRLYPERKLDRHVDWVIKEYFEQASRVEALSRKDRLRMKRHGKDTIYFRQNDFTFVVQNATIVTVEISRRGNRYLNKRPF